MKRHVSSLLSLCAAVIVVACMDGSRVGSVTGPASVALMDSQPDSLPPDSLPPDSLPPDSLPPDSLPPRDTLSRDTLQGLRAILSAPIAGRKTVAKARDHRLVQLLRGSR